MPTPEDLETVILQRIATPREDRKSNTRWVIITELAYELCAGLKREGVTSSDVAKKSRDFIELCRTIFLKLAAENKIELDLKTGECKLTEEGEKQLKESQQKTDHA